MGERNGRFIIIQHIGNKKAHRMVGLNDKTFNQTSPLSSFLEGSASKELGGYRTF
ncbi:MAG: hypothetical protein GY943_14430 [Chloroflexi bacterium]|nr:hypothetical protein [Chloroflexota bacterium]